MRKNKPEYLIILNTPFQYLCALEYLHKYNIDKTKCDLILISPLKKTLDQIKLIYPVDNFNKFKVPLSYSSFTLVSFIKTYLLLRIQSPKRLIIGNLLNPWSRYLIQNYRSKNLVIILDDGAGSIPIITKRNKQEYLLPLPVKLNRTNLFYKYFLKLNPEISHSLSFFTFFPFDNKSKFDEIRPNNLNLLKLRNNKEFIESNDLWFIGSPFFELNMVSINNYNSIIDSVKNHAKQNDLKFVYFPHRIEKLSQKNNLEIVKNDMPFELYYMNSIKKPKIIVSFYSTSLLVLSKLDLNSKLFSIKLDEKFRINNDLTYWKNVNLVYDFIDKEKKIEFLDINLIGLNE